MKKTYVVAALYTPSAEHHKLAQRLRQEVATVSRDDFHVLMESPCGLMIGFGSELERARITAQFFKFGADGFHSVVMEPSRLVSSYMPDEALGWIASRLKA